MSEANLGGGGGAGHLEVGGRDAASVVGDLEPLLAVRLEADLDGGGAGVEAVLDELLNGGGEVEDDLAGADAVHHRLADRLDRRRGAAASRHSTALNKPYACRAVEVFPDPPTSRTRAAGELQPARTPFRSERIGPSCQQPRSGRMDRWAV
jgi:hypothetical protein